MSFVFARSHTPQAGGAEFATELTADLIVTIADELFGDVGVEVHGGAFRWWVWMEMWMETRTGAAKDGVDVEEGRGGHPVSRCVARAQARRRAAPPRPATPIPAQVPALRAVPAVWAVWRSLGCWIMTSPPLGSPRTSRWRTAAVVWVPSAHLARSVENVRSVTSRAHAVQPNFGAWVHSRS